MYTYIYILYSNVRCRLVSWASIVKSFPNIIKYPQKNGSCSIDSIVKSCSSDPNLSEETQNPYPPFFW